MTRLKFHKLQALKNDFVLINKFSENRDINLDQDLIKKIADRKVGIGCDQVLVLENSKNSQADYHYRIFNQDGSEVFQCGNGLRAAGKYLDQHKIKLHTDFDIYQVEKTADNLFCASLGKIKKLEDNHEFVFVDIGNPHRVFFEPPPSAGALSPLYESGDHSPLIKGGSSEGAGVFSHNFNQSFCEILENNIIKIKIFERGVGETEGCGSAAAAVMAAAKFLKKIDNNKIIARFSGGDLEVEWSGNLMDEIKIIGDAEYVFCGEF